MELNYKYYQKFVPSYITKTVIRIINVSLGFFISSFDILLKKFTLHYMNVNLVNNNKITNYVGEEDVTNKLEEVGLLRIARD